MNPRVAQLQVWGELFLFFGLLCQSQVIAAGVAAGITLCTTVLIPSLLLFFLLTEWLTRAFAAFRCGKICTLLSCTLFHLPGEAIILCLLGCCGGYPIGARLTADRIAAWKLDRRQATALLLVTVCASPSFLVAGFAVPLYHSVSLGFRLWGAQVLATLLVGILFAPRRCPLPKQAPLATSARDPLWAALRSMALVCLYVLLFSGVGGWVNTLPLSETAKRWVLLGLEFTSGSRQIPFFPPNIALLCAAGAASFGGCCVQGQIFALLPKGSISLPQWILGRVLHGCFAIAFTAWLLPEGSVEVLALRRQQTLALSPHSLCTTPILLWMGVMVLLLIASFPKLPKKNAPDQAGA